MIAMQAIFQQAISGEHVWLPVADLRAGDNLRQRLYRARAKIRRDPQHPLTLLVDGLRFELKSSHVVVSYCDPDHELLENIHHDKEQTTERRTGTDRRSGSTIRADERSAKGQ